MRAFILQNPLPLTRRISFFDNAGRSAGSAGVGKSVGCDRVGSSVGSDGATKPVGFDGEFIVLGAGGDGDVVSIRAWMSRVAELFRS